MKHARRFSHGTRLQHFIMKIWNGTKIHEKNDSVQQKKNETEQQTVLREKEWIKYTNRNLQHVLHGTLKRITVILSHNRNHFVTNSDRLTRHRIRHPNPLWLFDYLWYLTKVTAHTSMIIRQLTLTLFSIYCKSLNDWVKWLMQQYSLLQFTSHPTHSLNHWLSDCESQSHDQIWYFAQVLWSWQSPLRLSEPQFPFNGFHYRLIIRLELEVMPMYKPSHCQSLIDWILMSSSSSTLCSTPGSSRWWEIR